VALRERRPTWGPKKLRRKLAERWPDLAPPASSTIGDWLRKEGLTRSRRPRRRCPPFVSPFQTVDAPHAVWCADFKGWFKTGEGKRCDPLTISDAMSRYLLRCEAVVQPDGDCVRKAFDAAFCEFGLPLAIRSDNGPPFASVGAGFAFAAVGVVDQAWRQARADRSRQAAAERPARAAAPHAQRRRGEPA
jgi:transposase InsO family protein